MQTTQKRFVLESQKYRAESTVISVRIPKDMLAELDSLADKKGRKRNDVIMRALQYALENLEAE